MKHCHETPSENARNIIPEEPSNVFGRRFQIFSISSIVSPLIRVSEFLHMLSVLLLPILGKTCEAVLSYA